MRTFYPWIFLVVGGVLGVPHFLLAYHFGQSDWITGYGALLIIFGVITIARPVVRLGYKNWFVSTQTEDWSEFDPQEGADAKAIQIFGPFLLVAGTLLNGYGAIIWRNFWS